MAAVVQLRTRVANAEALKGKQLTTRDVSIKLLGDTDVYKPDGSPLVMLRRGAIRRELSEAAYPALHKLRNYKTDNRSAYAGATSFRDIMQGAAAEKGMTQTRARRADGSRAYVASAVVGYFDRQGGRFPFCRETAFTAKETALWDTVLPMVDEASALFRRTSPTRWEKQRAAALSCAPEYIIGATPFSTLTVNNNVAPSAAHKDAGDFKEGLGLITVVRRGKYTGGWLVFPEYLVGVDLDDGDAIFFNSHDWHGVTAMKKKSDDAERISVVYYLRDRMKDCLPHAQELARAQARGEL